MKKFTPIFVGLLLSGCSPNPLNPNMKGLGFWEAPDAVKEAIIQKKSFDNISTCLSTFLLIHPETDWNDYDFTMRYGMGKPEIMAQRAMEKCKSIIRKEDFKSVRWIDVDTLHAAGEINFDAFYGRGLIKFKAVKIDGTWVISQMLIPSKEKDPLVVFDYSEEEAKKLVR